MQVINELVKTEDKSKLATMIDINGSEGEPYSATKMWWEKICRRAIQKLILQGVFSVYLVYERHNNVYLKVSIDVCQEVNPNYLQIFFYS